MLNIKINNGFLREGRSSPVQHLETKIKDIKVFNARPRSGI